MITTIVLVFALFSLIGMPLAYALGMAGFLGIIVSGYPLSQLPAKMIYSLDSFPLMAIPLFMLAGQLMIRGGIMDRIIDFANAIVGRVRGGLGFATIFAAMGLSSVSGTAVADATALGGTLGPSLSKAYGPRFGASLVAASSNLGPIIPPSSGMILYAMLAENVSVGALFVAGIIPGILLAVATMICCAILTHKRNFPTTGVPFNFRNVLRELRRSIIVFLMPILVIGGIIGGAFTATEGAAIAVLYAFFIGMFVTKKLRLLDLPQCLLNAAIVTAIVGALIAFASQVTYLFTAELVGVSISEWLQGITENKWVFIIAVVVLLAAIGMFMEGNAAYIMLVPIIAPIATTFGIDPLYFAFLFVLNITLGNITPPVGILLFVSSGIWNIKITDLIKEIWPFIVVQYLVMILCLAFPQVSLFLPRLLGY